MRKVEPAVVGRPALAPAGNTCDLAARQGADHLAKPSAAQFKSLKEAEKPPKLPCVPNGEAAPSAPQPHLPSGGDQH